MREERGREKERTSGVGDRRVSVLGFRTRVDRCFRSFKVRDSEISIEATNRFAAKDFRLCVAKAVSFHFIFLDLEQMFWLKGVLEVAAGKGWSFPGVSRVQGDRRELLMRKFVKKEEHFLNLAEHCHNEKKFFFNIPAERASKGWPSLLKAVASKPSFSLAGSVAITSRSEIVVSEIGVEDRIEFLARCVLFRFVNTVPEAVNWITFRSWAERNWGISALTRIVKLGDDLYLLECSSQEEVSRICSLRRCQYGSSRILLDVWTSIAGCTSVLGQQKLVWVQVQGIPLHLRSEDLFRKIGELCGGFINFDERLCDWNAVRIKVVNSSDRPESFMLKFRDESFRLVLFNEAGFDNFQVSPSKFTSRDKNIDGESDSFQTVAGGAISRVGEVWRKRRGSSRKKLDSAPTTASGGVAQPLAATKPITILDLGFSDYEGRSCAEPVRSPAKVTSEVGTTLDVDVNRECFIRGSHDGLLSEAPVFSLVTQTQKDVSEPFFLGSTRSEAFRKEASRKDGFVGLCLNKDGGCYVATTSFSPWQESTLKRLLAINLGSALSLGNWALEFNAFQSPCSFLFHSVSFSSDLRASISSFAAAGPPDCTMSQISSSLPSHAYQSSLGASADVRLSNSEMGNLLIGDEGSILDAVTKVASVIDLRLNDSLEEALESVMVTASAVLRRRKSRDGRSWTDRELRRNGWTVPLAIPLRGGALREWQQLILFLDLFPADHVSTGPPSVQWPLNSAGTKWIALWW
ncbi:hypothetical protein LINPERHAP2_LOCUS39720 [Linum perenne]